MDILKKKCILFFCILLFPFFLVYPNQEHKNRHKYGLAFGYGNQFAWNVNYNYKVYLYSFNYHYTLFTTVKDFSLELALQPQFNTATFYENNYQHANEYGVNVGALLRKKISNTSVYAMLSAGPHYVSNVPKRQANGFIFSDNLMIGVTYLFLPHFSIDLRAGVRHISNAGIQAPNGG